MTDMEQDFAGRIMEFAFSNYKGIEDVTNKQLTEEFWKRYLDVQDISAQEWNGMEMSL